MRLLLAILALLAAAAPALADDGCGDWAVYDPGASCQGVAADEPVPSDGEATSAPAAPAEPASPPAAPASPTAEPPDASAAPAAAPQEGPVPPAPSLPVAAQEDADLA
ncbi:MAG: hypothetical protein LC624_03145, partial [Halobacteriales archaeon]|nr:hypothetical protein [Halobacteriales archaeon]